MISARTIVSIAVAALLSASATSGVAKTGSASRFSETVNSPTVSPKTAALSLWSRSAARDRIVQFVREVTDPKSDKFVPVEERVAVFDNDGTLLCEKPAFFQVVFTRDQVLLRKDAHPEWQTKEPHKYLLDGNDQSLAKLRGAEASRLLVESQDGLTEEEFRKIAIGWLDTAKHERFNCRYVQLTYQPMVELLTYLRDNGFKTYICSGGGTDFIRCYAQDAYGIPPEQVIGTMLELEFEQRGGKSVIVCKPALQVYTVGKAKPVMIEKHIGRRPIIAVGNSDGDIEMIEYCTGGGRPSLGVLVHHDDAQREYQYDKGAERALQLAADRNWLVVSMKEDFKRVFVQDVSSLSRH